VTSAGGDAVPAAPVDGSERFPELARLFGTHLVESWRSMYGSTAEALRDGFDDRSIDELRAVLTELNDLLGLRLGEPTLRDVLYSDLGSYYSPADRTFSKWLKEVVREVHEAVKARATEPRSANPMAAEPRATAAEASWMRAVIAAMDEVEMALLRAVAASGDGWVDNPGHSCSTGT
jgi:hypothetical protein